MPLVHGLGLFCGTWLWVWMHERKRVRLAVVGGRRIVSALYLLVAAKLEPACTSTGTRLAWLLRAAHINGVFPSCCVKRSC